MTSFKLLHDYVKPGAFLDGDKERPWARLKSQNLRYSVRLVIQAMEDQDKKLHQHSYDVQSCGQVLEFVRNHDGRLILTHTWFCKDRFCPLCQWRRMLKVTVQMRKVIEQSLIEEPSSRFLFLTFTVKNVKGSELRSTVQKLNRQFSKFVHYKRVKADLIGFIRSTEVTAKIDDDLSLQFHPHIHVLLQVKSTYFKSGHYIKQDEWRELWGKAMGLSYLPQVHVSIIKPKTGNDSSVASSVAEVGKYSVKPSDYLSEDKTLDVQMIRVLREQMKGLRMLSFGGKLRDLYRVVSKDEDVDDDLVHTGDETEAEKDAEKITAIWNSHVNNYVITK